jgi:hypothetical protein
MAVTPRSDAYRVELQLGTDASTFIHELPRRGLLGNPEPSEQKKRAGPGALAFFHLYSSAPIKPDVISL